MITLTDAEYDGLKARIAELEAALHRQFNSFENITEADTLNDAKDMAHAQIALVTAETEVKI